VENEIQPNTPIVQPIKQTKILPLLLMGLIIATVSVYIGIQIGKNQASNQLSVLSEPIKSTTQNVSDSTTSLLPTITNSPSPNKVSTTISIDDTWNLYTNNKFGFSMKIPKITVGPVHNNCPEDYTVPTVTFEDYTGVYITGEYFFEYPQNGVCQKTVNNLNIISQRANQWRWSIYQNNPLYTPPFWHIITAKIETDTELESFVKTNYGFGCKVGTKSISPSGVYDVKIQGDGLELENTKCPINYRYALKYSPELKKAATWGAGQDTVFPSTDYKQDYDSEMINSFKFID